MSQLGAIDAGLNFGAGGDGISRQHFNRLDHGTILSSDANAAAAAWHGLWQTVHTELPFGGVVAWPSNCEVLDDGTAAPIGTVTITSVPATVTGSSTSHWEAGTGVRINWKTTTVLNRRLIRGATFLIPLTIDAFNTFGEVDATIQANYQTAVSTYLAAMATASLAHVAWHRPKKGTFTGGVAGAVVAGHVRGVGAWLSSRRT